MRFAFCFLIACALLAGGTVIAQEETGDGAAPVGGDLCEILEVASVVAGIDIVCPVFVPEELNGEPKSAALVVLPESLAAADRLIAEWSAGNLPDQDRAVLIVPRIDPGWQKERAFAVFSEIMRLASERYGIDPNRLAVWGLGDAGRHAFFAVRALPDKFAALVQPSDSTFLNDGLLDFVAHRPSNQIAMVRSDPATYRSNLSNVQTVPSADLPKTLDTLDKEAWRNVCSRLINLFSTSQSNPAKLSFWTDRLRFSECGAFRILRLEEWMLPAGFEARIVQSGQNESRIVCSTYNISMLSLVPSEGVTAIRIDGDLIECASGRPVTLQRTGRSWHRIDAPAVVMSRKHADASGPLSDALFTPCIFVFGTLGDQDKMSEWARRTAAEMGMKDVEVLSDTEVLGRNDLLENYTLVCFGDGNENRLVAELDSTDVPGENARGDSKKTTIRTYLRPSPYAIDRYVVVNEILNETGDIGPANLDQSTDWAVYHAESEAAVAVGSFDGDWKPQELPDNPWKPLRRED